MRSGLVGVQGKETGWIRQHLASLLYQGVEASCELILVGNADSKHLLGILPSWDTAQCGQSNGDAIGILDLTSPVLLAKPVKRFDWIGADGHAAL